MYRMVRFLPVAFLECALLAVPAVCAQSVHPMAPDAAVEAVSSPGGLPALPPMPGGTTTVVGGTIRDLDLVRDQFSLTFDGKRAMKILFDERTQVYRDGVKVPLRDLRPEAHASIQTTLDGSDVFAVSIHILSKTPEGECRGRILKFNPQNGELEVRTALSPEPVKLFVPANASIRREGQPSFTSKTSGRNDLVAGSLVVATFRQGQSNRDVADQITILAIPGTSFSFAGNISYIDLSMGLLDVVDPHDGKSYEIHFSSAHIPSTGTLHLGESVSVKAYYDGTQYQAAEITAR
jgi:hypothetical protein